MEHGSDVGIKGVVPLVVGDLIERLMGHLVSSVVDQDVDAAKLIDRCLNDVPTMLRISYVALHEHHAAARLFDIFRGVLGVGILTEIGNQYVGAFARVGDRNGASNARVATSDHGDLIGQLAAAFIALLTTVGYRSHLRLNARQVLLLWGLANLSSLILVC